MNTIVYKRPNNLIPLIVNFSQTNTRVYVHHNISCRCLMACFPPITLKIFYLVQVVYGKKVGKLEFRNSVNKTSAISHFHGSIRVVGQTDMQNLIV